MAWQCELLIILNACSEESLFNLAAELKYHGMLIKWPRPFSASRDSLVLNRLSRLVGRRNAPSHKKKNDNNLLRK